jgi:hypothetical protein
MAHNDDRPSRSKRLLSFVDHSRTAEGRRRTGVHNLKEQPLGTGTLHSLR